VAKWYTGKSPESRERHAEEIIYGSLPDDGSEVQWSRLKQMAGERGISSATLSKHLKDGVKIGMIGRRVDDSTYPPNVYYHKISPRNIGVLPADSEKLLLERVEVVREGFKKIVKEENARKQTAMADLLWRHLFAFLCARLSTFIISSCEEKKTFQEAEAYIETALNIDIIPYIKFLHGASYHAEVQPTLHKISADFFRLSGDALLSFFILSEKKELTEQQIEELSDIWTALKEGKAPTGEHPQ